MKSTEVAKAFVKVMDSEDYEPAKHFLTKDCRYTVGEMFYLGPDAIIETYKSHHEDIPGEYDLIKAFYEEIGLIISQS
jgi:hypothetical protein